MTDLTDQTAKATSPGGGNLSTLHHPGLFSEIFWAQGKVPQSRGIVQGHHKFGQKIFFQAVWKQVNFTSHVEEIDQFDWGLHDGHFHPTLIFKNPYYKHRSQFNRQHFDCESETYSGLLVCISLMIIFKISLIVSSLISIKCKVPAVFQTDIMVQTENGQLPKLETGILKALKLGKKLGVTR